MKINDITLIDLKQHLRMDHDDDDIYLLSLLDSAVSYIKNYTGLGDTAIYKIDELGNVAMMIVCDLYENRSCEASGGYKQVASINKIYESMLNMHCINLL